jgi:hypothetical protein
MIHDWWSNQPRAILMPKAEQTQQHYTNEPNVWMYVADLL